MCVCVREMTRGPNGPNLGLCVCDMSGWKSRLSAPINGVQGKAPVWDMSDFYGLESGTV